MWATLSAVPTRVPDPSAAVSSDSCASVRAPWPCRARNALSSSARVNAGAPSAARAAFNWSSSVATAVSLAYTAQAATSSGVASLPGRCRSCSVAAS